MTGRGDERIVDADDRERRDRPALGAKLVELRDLLFERTAGKRDAERALLERILERRSARGLLLEEAARARILALLVTPDAVVRLAERVREVHPAIGQRESVAPPDATAGELPGLGVADVRRVERNELHRVDLARRAEEHAALVQRAAFGGVRGPGRVAQRDVELGGVSALVALPGGHRVGEAELAERLAQCGFELGAQRCAVERFRGLGPIRIHRLALDELALHDVKRRELVVQRFELTHFRLDPEQRRDKVLEVRSDRDQEIGFLLACQRVRVSARRIETIGERRVGGRKMSGEQFIDPRGAFDRVEIGERESVR